MSDCTARHVTFNQLLVISLVWDACRGKLKVSASLLYTTLLLLINREDHCLCQKSIVCFDILWDIWTRCFSCLVKAFALILLVKGQVIFIILVLLVLLLHWRLSRDHVYNNKKLYNNYYIMLLKNLCKLKKFSVVTWPFLFLNTLTQVNAQVEKHCWW